MPKYFSSSSLPVVWIRYWFNISCRAGAENPNVSEIRLVREMTSSGVKLRRSHASQSARTFSFPVQSLTVNCVATWAKQGSLSAALFKASG